MTAISTPSIAKFKQFYDELCEQSIDNLGNIYDQSITFSDPIHTINGLDALTRYFKTMCGNLSECRFIFTDEVIVEDGAFFKWEMHYRHPSLKSNQALQLVGASLIKFSGDKIISHEDFYDMGAMLYEHIPLLGSVIRLIKSRIEKS